MSITFDPKGVWRNRKLRLLQLVHDLKSMFFKSQLHNVFELKKNITCPDWSNVYSSSVGTCSPHFPACAIWIWWPCSWVSWILSIRSPCLAQSSQVSLTLSFCLHHVCHLGLAPVWTGNGWACSPWDQGSSSCPAFSGRTSPGTICPGKQWVDNFPNNSDSSFILKRFVIVSSWPGHPLQSSLGKSLHRSRSSVDWYLQCMVIRSTCGTNTRPDDQYDGHEDYDDDNNNNDDDDDDNNNNDDNNDDHVDQGPWLCTTTSTATGPARRLLPCAFSPVWKWSSPSELFLNHHHQDS